MEKIWAKYPHYVFIGALALFVVIVFIVTIPQQGTQQGSQKNYITANKPAVQQQAQRKNPAVAPLAIGPVELVDLAQNPTPDLAGSLYMKGIWIKPKNWKIPWEDVESSASAIFPIAKKFDEATFSLGQERPKKNLSKYVSFMNIEIYADEKKVWEKKIARDKPITSDIPLKIDLKGVSMMTVRLTASNDFSQDVLGYVLGDLEFTKKVK